MTKNTTQEAAAAAESLLLNDWFDPIEDGVRARVRGFIETMLEAELSEALSRPRYGRRRLGEDETTPSVVGMRRGHRERTLTGTFGKTRIAVPRARLMVTTARRANGGAVRCAFTSAAPGPPMP